MQRSWACLISTTGNRIYNASHDTARYTLPPFNLRDRLQPVNEIQVMTPSPLRRRADCSITSAVLKEPRRQQLLWKKHKEEQAASWGPTGARPFEGRPGLLKRQSGSR
ncbi:hypothetical protein EOD39_8593 [Acipenser ruthenus]|uniref:Uncharacterized protein n=1 Tax=Acipenser ruthenus TaxID=7906 RepID=A0A444U3G3_ACIRT|nr:hypothetical protein EOD39_8593 [Acipenser ruthenus]